MSDPDRVEPANAPVPNPPMGRWGLIRDLFVFQGKLLLDGFRDLVMGPLSIVAAVVGLITGNDKAHNAFYDVLRWGERSERWINLFGAVRDPASKGPVDVVVETVERAVVTNHNRGGASAKARATVDRVLDRVQGARPEAVQDPSDPKAPR